MASTHDLCDWEAMLGVVKQLNCKLLALIGVSFGMSASTPAVRIAVGDQMPSLRGEFLTGRTAILPEAASGRVALLLLGFSYESRFSVEAWAKRFRHDFAGEPRVTFFEIPMIGGAMRLGKWFIDSGMRRGTPKADQENVITVYGGTDIWKQRMGFDHPEAAYLLLIDQNGRVAWHNSGGFDEARYEALLSESMKLLGRK